MDTRTAHGRGGGADATRPTPAAALRTGRADAATAAMFPPLPTAADVADLLDAVRARAPRLHVSMNTVAQLFVANVATALGADVSMTDSADEIGPMAGAADALLLNLGTLSPARREGILVAADAARTAGRPIVLDPVKVDRSPPRLAFAADLVEEGVAVVKGNPAEIEALAPALAHAAGPVVIARTGAMDEIEATGRPAMTVANGDPLLARLVATGCASGVVIAAMAAVTEDAFAATVAGLSVWGVAAEMAAEGGPGPGTFAVRLVDAVASVGRGELLERARLGHG